MWPHSRFISDVCQDEKTTCWRCTLRSVWKQRKAVIIWIFIILWNLITLFHVNIRICFSKKHIEHPSELPNFTTWNFFFSGLQIQLAQMLFFTFFNFGVWISQVQFQFQLDFLILHELLDVKNFWKSNFSMLWSQRYLKLH